MRLEERPAPVADLSDIALCALDAHARPQISPNRERFVVVKLRRSVLAVLRAWAALVMAEVGFQRMIGYEDFVGVARERLCGSRLRRGSGRGRSAVLAISSGGLPIALATIRRAAAEGHREVPLLLAVPPLALAAFVGYTFLLTRMVYPAVEPLTVQDKLKVTLFLSLVGVFMLAAAASTLAVSTAVSRVELDERLFRFALFPACSPLWRWARFWRPRSSGASSSSLGRRNCSGATTASWRPAPFIGGWRS